MSAIPVISTVDTTVDDIVASGSQSTDHNLNAQDMESKLRLLELNYRTYSGPLTKIICSKFNLPYDLAQEMVQEAYIKAFKNLDSYTNDGKMKAWITMIARNHTVSYLRSVKRQKRYVTETAIAMRSGASQALQAPVAPVLVGAREFLRDTDDAITRIPKAYQQAVRLRKRGLAYKEIGKELGCPKGTVMSRLKRGLDHMKEIEPSIHDYV